MPPGKISLLPFDLMHFSGIWDCFHTNIVYIAKEPKEDMSPQLNNLLTTDMLETMFSDFEYPGQCLYDNSSWDSISGKKLFTDKDQNSIEKLIRRKSLSYLMKITIESPQKLNDDLETIVGIWTRKTRRIVI